MRFAHVRVDNFRSLRDVRLDLSPLTVIIGANGAGKSSLLEAISYFSHLPSGITFSNLLAPQGGFPGNRSWYANMGNDTIDLGISLDDGSERIDYDVRLRGEGPSGCFIESETLGKSVSDKLEPAGGATSFRRLMERRDNSICFATGEKEQTPHGSSTVLHRWASRFSEAKQLLSVVPRISRWQAHRFLPEGSVRTPQQLLQVSQPLENGQDLYSVLYTMRIERPREYRELEEVMRLAVPELQKLEFPPVGGGSINLAWHQSNFPQPFYPVQLSDGVLRFLWLMAVLHSAPDDGLILLDEPELSLHPQWLLLLVSVARSMSARTTIVFATQSVELVRWVEPAELVVADMTETGTRLSRVGDRADIEEWLQDFTLDQMWTMGELGGRR